MDLTPDQQAEAQRLFEQLQGVFLEEARRLAQLLAAKPTPQLLGATEFEVREAVHRLGARTLEAALDGRKKGGTKAPACPVRAVSRLPAARASGPVRPCPCWVSSAYVATITFALTATRAPAPWMSC